MKEWNAALPNASVVRRALRQATERLAAELAQPTDWAPDWDDFEWRAAMAVSVMHGISGLLAGRLRWSGSPAWRAFLVDQAGHAQQREQRVRQLLAELNERARRAGLPMLAMKGSALLQLGLYTPGERPMSDVDLLARNRDAADEVILATSYERSIVQSRHVAYEPLQQPDAPAFGEHEANPIKIELHDAVYEPLPRRQVDITAQLLPRNAEGGLHTYSSLGALMRHLLLHAAGNLCNRCVRLIQLHDIAMLAPRLQTNDWAEALAPASDGLPAWWAAPPLQLTQRLFPDSLPLRLLTRIAAACPFWLRRASARYELTDVSLSRLSIPMLPGIEWSRSPIEALAFAQQRLHPGRAAQATVAQILPGQHSLAGSAWSYRPRWLKALSFMLGAPPRVQTLYSLHRALDYRPSSSA